MHRHQPVGRNPKGDSTTGSMPVTDDTCVIEVRKIRLACPLPCRPGSLDVFLVRKRGRRDGNRQLPPGSGTGVHLATNTLAFS
jgi:hypothetical protein